MTTTTDETTHLRALLAEQTARAERAEAATGVFRNDAIRYIGLLAEATDRAEKAEAACAEMRAALEAVARRCGGCNGKGLRTRPCIYCCDSTHDHVCDEQEIDCEMCKSLRALLSCTDLGRCSPRKAVTDGLQPNR